MRLLQQRCLPAQMALHSTLSPLNLLGMVESAMLADGLELSAGPDKHRPPGAVQANGATAIRP